MSKTFALVGARFIRMNTRICTSVENQQSLPDSPFGSSPPLKLVQIHKNFAKIYGIQNGCLFILVVWYILFMSSGPQSPDHLWSSTRESWQVARKVYTNQIVLILKNSGNSEIRIHPLMFRLNTTSSRDCERIFMLCSCKFANYKWPYHLFKLSWTIS